MGAVSDAGMREATAEFAQRFAALMEDHGRVTAELTELRAVFHGEAETIAPDLAASERKASAWWYAAWKVGNRIRAELAVTTERAKVRVLELEAELAKERERTAGMLGALALHGHLCTEACEASPVCGVCHQRKAPRGRSVADAMAGSRCTWACAGYDQEPCAGHLWPGERADQ